MERDEQIELMAKSGFSAPEITWIVKRAGVLGVSVNDFLLELASAFPKILKCHIVVAVIMIGFIVLDPKSGDKDTLTSYVVTWLFGCIGIKTQGPLIKTFKSYRMINKIKKGAKK